jgi:hypothetical protein
VTFDKLPIVDICWLLGLGIDVEFGDETVGNPDCD